MFATHFKPNKVRFRKERGKRIVETAGYRSAKFQIEELMAAGKRLTDFRKGQYDFPEGTQVDEKFSDPTRSPNFDMADASAILRDVRRNIKRRKKDEDKPGITNDSSDNASKSDGSDKEPNGEHPDGNRPATKAGV